MANLINTHYAQTHTHTQRSGFRWGPDEGVGLRRFRGYARRLSEWCWSWVREKERGRSRLGGDPARVEEGTRPFAIKAPARPSLLPACPAPFHLLCVSQAPPVEVERGRVSQVVSCEWPPRSGRSITCAVLLSNPAHEAAHGWFCAYPPTSQPRPHLSAFRTRMCGLCSRARTLPSSTSTAV